MTDVRGVDPVPSKSSTLARETTREADHDTFTDEWGITWKMPVEGGLYFDMCKHPLADAESVADLEKFPRPDSRDPARFANMKQQANRFVHEDSTVTSLPQAASS